MGENHQYTGRSFSFLVLNSNLDVEKVPELARTTANLYSRCESVFPTSGIKLNTKKRNMCPVNCVLLVLF